LGFCFKQGKEKTKQKDFAIVLGGKQTLVCSRTVHSSTVVVHFAKPPEIRKEWHF